jgi:tetratricopeptide (TPR) repeat protein
MSSGLPRAARAGTTVYLAVGEYENENLRGGVQRLVDALKAGNSTTVPEWSYTEIKDQDHNSMPLPSLYWALEARYVKWRFPFFETLAELDSLGGLKALENHYDRFSKHFGYAASVPEDRLSSVASIYIAADRHAEVLDFAARYAAAYPRSAEGWVNRAAYDLLRRGRIGPAIAAFTKNTERFPESANAHDSMGEAYCRSGDKAAGQRSYQEAARIAATRTPPSPRLAQYQAKAAKGCDP